MNYDIFFLPIAKGRVQKLKSAKVWSLTIEGGGGGHSKPNPYSDQFFSDNLTIFSANLKNSE